MCLGNICRSPSAEGIFQKIIEEQSLQERLMCDSAGTSSYHVGAAADPRSIKHAKKRGYKLLSRARQFQCPEDFETFHWILTMDRLNYQNILQLDPKRRFHHKVLPITDYCKTHHGG